MPYIKQDVRSEIDPKLSEVCDYVRPKGAPVGDAGVLNYILTQIGWAFLGGTPNYARFNALVGAMECAKLELYRRLVAPYEDEKARINGDVF